MDLLPKTRVGVRSSAPSAIYHAALMRGVIGCYDLLTGTHADFTRPTFDFALPVRQFARLNDLDDAPDVLPRHLPAAKELARHADNVVVGIFLAWECISLVDRHKYFGLFVDLARALSIPYVVSAPIDGRETIWAASIFFANRFPHDALPYKRLPCTSDEPKHNPRRIARLWKLALRKVG